MRSDLIYDALKNVQNRYLLCQLTSKATRKLHKPNTRVQETMNDVLHRFGRSETAAQPRLASEEPQASQVSERRAA